jgi:MoaD family protein
MKITIRGFFNIREAMGKVEKLEMEAENVSVREILLELSDRYGAKFKEELFDPGTNDIRPENQILVNGRHYRYLPGGLDRTLQDGDTLAIFPLVAGG